MKNFLSLSAAVLMVAAPAFGNVSVTSPASGATVTSPVHYVATATTTTCSKGVASIGVYVDNQKIYVVKGASLNTSITMSPGSHNTTVEEWDNCGGATVDHIALTVVVPSVSVTANNSTITAGSLTTLTVTAAGASSVTLTGSNGTTFSLGSSGGKVTVSPSANATYTAAAMESSGRVTSSA